MMSASESDSSTEVCSDKHYRRKRTIITPDQLSQLETAFMSDPWPVRHKKEQIAQDLGKSEVFVSTWFQNKRARVRRTEELNLPKPSASVVKEDNVKTVSVEDKDGNKYLKIVRVSPSHAFEDVTRRTQVVQEDILDVMDEEQFDSERQSIIQSRPVGKTKESLPMPIFSKPLKDDTLKVKYPDEHPTQTSTSKVAAGRSAQSQNSAALQQLDPQRCSDKQKTGKSNCLFYSIIDMMAMAEGGIIHATDPEFRSSVSNALYGILINGNSRITYDKVLGLDIVEFVKTSDK